MDKLRCIIWCIMLLIFTANWAPEGRTEQDLPSDRNVSDKKNTSPERVSSQGIPCNWSGWKNSFPEVKCDYDRCAKHREILMMKCSDGFITEVKAGRVCSRCFEF
jgi:hypothetical protein